MGISRTLAWWIAVSALLLTISPLAALAQNSGASVSGTFSGLVYNRATQTFNSILTLTNNRTTALPSPLNIVISTGTPGVTVAGTSDGSTDVVTVPGGSLAAGASAAVTVAFSDPSHVSFVPVVTRVAASGFLQATVGAPQGGNITASGASNPLNGTQVVIPADALGDPTDTITINAASALPGPESTSAVAAGITPISAYAVTLTKSGQTPFQNDVQVTIPFNAAALGPNDYPAVGYWSSALQQYEPAQIVSFDRAAGLVTFATKHFSTWVVFTLPGLGSMLNGQTPWASKLTHLNTGFIPAIDGFEIQNFGTGLAGGFKQGSTGVCFGMVSYAAWYFQKEKPAAGGLYVNYQATSDPYVTHIPEEDAVARELVAATYIDTVKDYLQSYSHGDALTAFEFIFWMESTNSPQIAYVNTASGKDPHSVLVYRWAYNSSNNSINFGIYDPNAPAPQPQPPDLMFGVPSGFASWASVADTYTQILFDAYGNHYQEDVLEGIYQNAQTGPPEQAWRFGGVDLANRTQGLTATSPLGGTAGSYPYGTNGVGTRGSLLSSVGGGTFLQFTWTCPDCDSAQGPWYLHVLQNGVPLTPTPTPITNGQTVPVATSALFNSLYLITPVNELIAFVDTDSYPTPTNQFDILGGYAAFFRTELTSSVPGETFITVQGTISSVPNKSGPLVVGQPFSLTIDWFPFVVSNEPGWNNNCVGVNPFTSYSVCYGASLAYGGNPPPNNYTTLTVGNQIFSTPNGDTNFLILGAPTGGNYAVMISASGFDRDAGISITSVASPFPDPFETPNVSYSSSGAGQVTFSSEFWQINTNSSAYSSYGNGGLVTGQITSVTITTTAPPP